LIDRILPDLYRITLPMPFRLRHVHVYALLHDGKVALFDTGMNIPETYTVLDEALANLGKTTKDIDRIFLTHFHADHCGIAGRIQEISGAAVHLSAVDESRLQQNNRLEELAGRPFGEERPREALVPGGEAEAALAVVAALDRDDAAPLGGTPRGLQRHLHRLAPAGREDGVGEVSGRDGRQSRGQLGARAARKVVVSDVQLVQGGAQRVAHLGVPMAEVEDAAVQVEVEQLAAVEVPDPIALAAPDHEVDAEATQGRHPVRADVPLGQLQHPALRFAHRLILLR